MIMLAFSIQGFALIIHLCGVRDLPYVHPFDALHLRVQRILPVYQL